MPDALVSRSDLLKRLAAPQRTLHALVLAVTAPPPEAHGRLRAYRLTHLGQVLAALNALVDRPDGP